MELSPSSSHLLEFSSSVGGSVKPKKRFCEPFLTISPCPGAQRKFTSWIFPSQAQVMRCRQRQSLLKVLAFYIGGGFVRHYLLKIFLRYVCPTNFCAPTAPLIWAFKISLIALSLPGFQEDLYRDRFVFKCIHKKCYSL